MRRKRRKKRRKREEEMQVEAEVEVEVEAEVVVAAVVQGGNGLRQHHLSAAGRKTPHTHKPLTSYGCGCSVERSCQLPLDVRRAAAER